MSTYKNIVDELTKSQVTLVAVSKTRNKEEILTLYNQGHRTFGENRVQELQEKYNLLPKDIEWHLIGSLQKNKVKYIAPFITMIHSVDSFKLLDKINTEAIKNNRIISVLLQIKIAQEDSKHGLHPKSQRDEIDQILTQEWSGVKIEGLMGMASFVDDNTQIKHEFDFLSKTFEEYKRAYRKDDNSFKHLSMGMSGDYKTAIACGTTMVRIGSLLFGPRA